jgi:hypothetical protein
MTDQTTARHGLPLIVPGQAQKEMTHNEALALLDLIAQPSVVAIAPFTPPENPGLGECWIVGMDALGAWAGHEGAIAGWSAGGWRFAAPRDGMIVWNAESENFARYASGTWRVGELLGEPTPFIPMPSGGMTVDEDARDAIAAVIMTLRHYGLVARS